MVNIVYYTNCQYRCLDYFLHRAIKGLKTYHIENYTLIKNKEPIPLDILKCADIFIYQPIDKRHGIYSTDDTCILSHLPPGCKRVSFPYIYNSSLWVLIPPANIDGYIGGYSGMDKYINSEPIEKLKAQGHSLDVVLQKYSNGEIDFDYENRFTKSIEILKKKEEICDVKVAEFIEQNIRKHKLFFTQNHPTTCVMVHCVNQILSILGHDYKYDEFAYPDNICNLPGKWPHTSYDVEYWNFEYDIGNINNGWYVNHIRNIYDSDDFFKDIFRRHSFESMNDMDVPILTAIFKYHKDIFGVTDSDIVFDVGANCGSFIKTLSALKKTENIHCFEPHPILSKMTKDLSKGITMNEVCLSDRVGSVVMNFTQTSLAISSIIDRPLFKDKSWTSYDSVKRVECECLTVDHYCEINNIDGIHFIKIDVEGAEKMVLDGAKNMLESRKIKGGVLEIIPSQLNDAGTSPDEIETILKGYGYKIVKTLSKNDWYFHIDEYLFPLSYSIPMKFIKRVDQTIKTRLFSPLIPGDTETYIYKDEDSYNNGYGDSCFSFTYKKGGYDCLRHYEILANNSIPYYIDIDEIPSKTMTTFPKSIIKNAMGSLMSNCYDLSSFDKYIQELNDYTINNLTCEKTAENFIDLLDSLNGRVQNKKVLMINNGVTNYSIMTLAYGLRQNLKSEFVDFPRMSQLYTKEQFNLHIEDDVHIDRENISDKIKARFYDYVIIGSVGPDETTNHIQEYEHLVQSSYKKTEIVYIFGGDRPFNIVVRNRFHDFLKRYLQKGVCFVRELDDNTGYYHDDTWNGYVIECKREWDKKIESAYSITNQYS